MSDVERYFSMLEQIKGCMSLRQYGEVLRLSYESLALVPSLIAWCRHSSGRFDIKSIPCIEYAARFSSAQGDIHRLRQLHDWLATIPELEPWLVIVKERMTGAEAQMRILGLLEREPGILQNQLPERLAVSGRVTGRLVADMESLGYLVRRASDKTYALYLPPGAQTVDCSCAAAPSTSTRASAPPTEYGLSKSATEPPDLWIALDFETATSQPNSACSIGIAVIDNGIVTGSGAWLIKPPGNCYDRGNVAVHGITPKRTKKAPTYRELYPQLAPYLEGRQVLAHWAQFDMNVLRAVHTYYRLPLPNLQYACSCRMAQAAFPRLRNHRLPTVCGHCGISLDHHDAASDALACALVACHCRDNVGAKTIQEALEVLRLQLREP